MIELAQLTRYQENNRLEAKKAQGGLPHSLWETYSAFANTVGGVLLLGVIETPEKYFQTVALSDPQKLADQFWQIVTNPASA
ncbi:AlbA family DNA-binding domain-containing protein [Holdemania massiliensis]|uniref:AlbA family DNA-binding domain-containing protein n=1 Tax=Holdemania massiliensis TaxID=1468449 RepID=UPI003564D321